MQALPICLVAKPLKICTARRKRLVCGLGGKRGSLGRISGSSAHMMAASGNAGGEEHVGSVLIGWIVLVGSEGVLFCVYMCAL